MKKTTSFIFALVALASVATLSASAASGNCKDFYGSNVDRNSYEWSNWSQPVYSYLSKCSDGNYMRVQYGIYNSDYDRYEKILIEYYDKNFNFISYKFVKPVLPIFGAFYETEENYYVLSGQSNFEEKANVDCYNIAKYDKNWKLIDSVGLKDCNTTLPFRGGSARISDYGDYLMIRTCHEMYKTEDGRNHQANVTIQVRMSTMEITDSFTDIANTSVGYSSHSFNQFIHVDNGKTVALDHGDGYPRSVEIFLYPHNVDTGKFYGNCASINMLDIPGQIGANYTGCSVGGFEISDTSYIVAGNCINYDKYDKSSTRNIFISVMHKAQVETEEKETVITYPDGTSIYTYEEPENNGTVTMLTSYKEGSDSAENPHLVKINNNRLFVIWSRGDKVYYQELNGKGETVGKTKSFKGALSDCKPIVSGNKLLWYTYANKNDDRNFLIGNELKFYTIDLNDTSKTDVITIESGSHNYKVTKVIEKATFAKKGKQKVVCKTCGKETTQTVPKKTVGKVKNLKTTSVSKTKVNLKWSKADNAKSYIIYMSTDGKNWKKLATTSKTKYKVTKLNSGVAYRFRIKAANGKYQGKDSSVLKVKTKLATPEITLKSGKKKANITIKSVRGATYYQILYSTDKNFETNVKKVYVDDAKSVKATVKKLRKGKRYYFKVRACCKYNGKKIYSSYTGVKSVKIK